MNIQCATLEDMTAAYLRCRQLGYRIMMGVGQHTNDRELSFYCVTPSGFELEVGWNPVLVTPELDAAWEVTTYQGISIWGHDDVGLRALDRLSQVRQAVLSARAREVSVPELSGAAAGGLTS